MLTVDFARLDVRPGMRVLDAGCGQGRHSLEVLRRGALVASLDLLVHDLRYTRYLLRSLCNEQARQASPETRPLAAQAHAALSGPAPAFAQLLQRLELSTGDPQPVSAPPSTRAEGGIAPGVEALAPAGVATRAPTSASTGLVPGNAAQTADPFLTLRGNTLALPFADACFDRVLCSEVLEHVSDPGAAAAELARVLKPGGLLAASVPTPFTEWVYWFGSDDYFNSPGGHVRIFTPGKLFRLLAQHGLTVVDVHFEHAFHSLYWWVRCVFGLHDEQHPAIRHFKRVLTHAMFSRPLTRAEHWANWIWPKSMVVYARKG